ncbi:MAG: NACHT domain-containing protein [Magnetococcales bacterium]|nr:NACHT domain-containing protein [Magnetococcales bacterium]
MNKERRLELRRLAQDNLRAIPWMENSGDSFEQRQWHLRYRKYLIDTYKDADFSGVVDANQRTPMALVSIFVPEQFSQEEISPSSPHFAEMISQPDEELEDLLITWDAENVPVGISGRRLVIIGEPGSGKSALIRVLAAGCAETAYNTWNTAFGRRLVLPLILRDLNLTGVRTTEELLQRWAVRVERDHPGLLDLSVIQFYLRVGWAIVAFDGVDEIGFAARRRLRRLILSFAARYPRAIILVTGRPAGFTDWSFNNPPPRLWRAMCRREELPETTICPAFERRYLRPFTDQQVENYLERWFKARFPQEPVRQQQKIERLLPILQNNQSFALLKRRPIYLATLTYVHDVKGELPNSMVEAYRAMVEAYLDILEAAKELDDRKKGLVTHVFDRLTRRRILERLAYDLHTKKLGSTPAGEKSPFHLQFNTGEFIAWVERWLQEARNNLAIEPGSLPSLLKFYQLRAGLLVSPEEGLLRFSHLSFQEFLTASWVLRNRNLKKGVLVQEMLEQLHVEEWYPVGLNFFGLLHRSEEAEVQEDLLQGWIDEDPKFSETTNKISQGRLRFLHKLLCDGEQGLSPEFLLSLWQYYWKQALSNFDSDWFKLYLAIAERWQVWGEKKVSEWTAQRFARLPQIANEKEIEATCREITLLGALPKHWLEERWKDVPDVPNRWHSLVATNNHAWVSLDVHGSIEEPRTLLLGTLSLVEKILLIDFDLYPSPISVLIYFQHDYRGHNLLHLMWAMESLLHATNVLPWDRERDLARQRDLARPRDLARVQDMELNIAWDMARRLNWGLDLDLLKTKDRAWARTWDWTRDRAWDQPRALELEWDLHQNQVLAKTLDLARGLNLNLDRTRDLAQFYSQWYSPLVFAQSAGISFFNPQQAIEAFQSLREQWPNKKELDDLSAKEWFPLKHIQKLKLTNTLTLQPLEALSHKLFRLLRYWLEKNGGNISDLPEELGPDVLRPGTLFREWHGEEAEHNYLQTLREAGYDPDKEPWPPLDQDQWVEKYKQEKGIP